MLSNWGSAPVKTGSIWINLMLEYIRNKSSEKAVGESHEKHNASFHHNANQLHRLSAQMAKILPFQLKKTP